MWRDGTQGSARYSPIGAPNSTNPGGTVVKDASGPLYRNAGRWLVERAVRKRSFGGSAGDGAVFALKRNERVKGRTSPTGIQNDGRMGFGRQSGGPVERRWAPLGTATRSKSCRAASCNS